MSLAVESGLMKGRPFGGVIAMIHNNLRNVTETVYSCERCCMVKVGNYLIANVYLPCSGTDNRLLIIQDLLADIWSWRERFNSCEFITAGDLNVDLDSVDTVSNYINSFLNEHSLSRCDLLAGKAKTATYVNEALNHYSTIMS